MKNNILNKISENHKLVSFCNKILSYNAIFNDEMARSMFFVSLISSDILLDKHACDETIDTADFILKNIDLFMIDDNIKKDVIKYMNDAIKIAKRDKKTL